MSDMVDVNPKGLEHLAYLTWDTAATVKFYEEVLGMPLVHAIVDDKVPSANVTNCTFLHTFFDMGGDSHSDSSRSTGCPPRVRMPNMPDWPRHIAIKVDSLSRRSKRAARICWPRA